MRAPSVCTVANN